MSPVPVTHDYVVAYRRPTTAEVTTRRAVLVRPPGHHPLVVVTESHEDTGWPIQLAAEEIADTIAQDFPGHTLVLHYDNSRDTATAFSLTDWWMPVPPDEQGRPVFGFALSDHPEVLASLRAAGLVAG